MGLYRLGNNYTLTVSESAANSNAFSSHIRKVRVATTTDCHIAIGKSAVATTNDPLMIAAGGAECFVTSEGERLSCIQQTAGGTLTVTELPT